VGAACHILQASGTAAAGELSKKTIKMPPTGQGLIVVDWAGWKQTTTSFAAKLITMAADSGACADGKKLNDAATTWAGKAGATDVLIQDKVGSTTNV